MQCYLKLNTTCYCFSCVTFLPSSIVQRGMFLPLNIEHCFVGEKKGTSIFLGKTHITRITFQPNFGVKKRGGGRGGNPTVAVTTLAYLLSSFRDLCSLGWSFQIAVWQHPSPLSPWSHPYPHHHGHIHPPYYGCILYLRIMGNGPIVQQCNRLWDHFWCAQILHERSFSSWALFLSTLLIFLCQGKDSEKWKDEKERLAKATLEERREVDKLFYWELCHCP